MNPFPVSHWGGSPPFTATPSFHAPLMNTLIPTIALGTSTPTFAVSATTATVDDWEHMIRPTKAGEAIFTGARRVENLIAGHSENFTNASWTKLNNGTGSALPVATANFATDPIGGSTASRFQFTLGSDAAAGYSLAYQTYTFPTPGVVRKFRLSCWMKANSGTPTLAMIITDGAGGSVAGNVTLTSSWVRYSITITTALTSLAVNPNIGVFGTNYGASGNTAAAIDTLIWGALLEDTSGQSNQYPSEYVSIGVLSAPWHGANVDAVKYFATLNGNTVSSNIVTEATGAAINTANGASIYTCDAIGPFGFLSEEGPQNAVGSAAETFAASWSLTNVTAPGASGTASPAGYTTPNALVENSTTGIHGADLSSLPNVGGGYACASIFVKKGLRDLALWAITTGTNYCQTYITWTAGVPTLSPMVGGTYSSPNSGVIPYPNGWYRLWMTFSTTSGSCTCQFRGNDGASYAGSNGSVAIYGWGMHFQAGMLYPHLPSYTSASRGIPSLTYPFASNASASAGTCYAEVNSKWTTAPDNEAVIAFGTASNYPLYSNSEASTTIRANDGTNTVQKTGLNDTATAMRKRAASWTGSTLLVTGDGLAPASGTFDGTMPSTAIGVCGPTTYTGVVWQGNIRNVKIYTVAATADQLATMTA